VELRRLLTLDAVYRIAPPLLLFALLQSQHIAPHDFWWHVRTGEIIAQTGSVPTLDSFSFTRAGEVWVNQSWLMQLALYGAFASGGAALVLFLHASAIAGGYTLLLGALQRSCGLRSGTAAGLVAAALGIVNWTVRPQSISFLLFGILIALIELHRRGRERALWACVPLFALWVNAHGAFVFGLLALGSYVIGELALWLWSGRPAAGQPRALELAGAGLASLAVLVLNPEGPLGMLEYVLGFVRGSPTTRIIEEFQPLELRTPQGVVFFGAWLLLGALLARDRARPALDQILALGVFGALALLFYRCSPWFGFVYAPVLARQLAPRFDAGPVRTGRARAIPAAYLALALLAVVSTLPWLRGSLGPDRPLLRADTPVAAMQALCTSAADSARVYTELHFASYQTWACRRLPVFQDTRAELYPLAQWRDFLRLRAARFDWQEIADRYALTHLLLSRVSQTDLIEAARASDRWVERYQDPVAVLLERAQLAEAPVR